MKSFLRSLLYNKKVLCAFSVIVAFAMWLMISIYQNPVREHVISNITVNIHTENTVVSELGMDIIDGGIGEKVNVRISGPNYIVSSLSASDILVSASFSNVTAPGSYDLELIATANSAKSGYTILNITPSKISAKFDYIDTKAFTVIPKAIGVGTDVEGGMVADTEIISNNENATITIKGPRTDMELIDKVVAEATVNKKLDATQSFDADIKLLDAEGNELDKSPFTISNEVINITVPVALKAQMPIQATFANAPDGFQNFLKYSLEVESATVLGPPETVSKLTKIDLDSIDFYNISKDNNSFDVAPLLPDGVKFSDNISYVTVAINTSELSEKTFSISNIECKNVPSNLTASSGQTIRKVKICGPSSVVKSLSADDLYAEIDLTGKAAGEHTVSAKILSRNGDAVWQVGEYSVIITLS